jgi:hypothetical protein
MGIMNHIEVEARYEIELEEYTKKIQIEGFRRYFKKSRNPNSYSLPKYFNRKRKRFKRYFELNLNRSQGANYFN